MSIYWDTKRATYIVRAKRSGQGADSPKRKLSRERFAKAAALVKRATPEEVIQAMADQQNSPFTWKDILMRAAFGGLIEWRDPDGSLWRGVNQVNQEASSTLDAITNKPGSILVRLTDGWYGLDPGLSNQVLTMNHASGFPDWEDAQGGGGTAFDGYFNNAAGYTTGNTTANRLSMTPVLIPRGYTVTNIAAMPLANSLTAQHIGCLYSDNGATANPSGLLAQTATITGLTGGVLNSVPLITPYTASNDEIVWIGYLANAVSAMRLTADAGHAFVSLGSFALPATLTGTISRSSDGGFATAIGTSP